MMHSHKKNVRLLAVSIGLAVFTLLGLLGTTATVQAAPTKVLVTFTDTSLIQHVDPDGNVLGEGVFLGKLRCVGDTCNQKIAFVPALGNVVYEYTFKSRLAFDSAAERVVVTGTGTVFRDGSKTRFSFTGVFQNNPDDTVQVTYEASMPDASFNFPAVPGSFSVMNSN
jgi:hypothetical protein